LASTHLPACLPGCQQFAVNTLGAFALTLALEPALHASAAGARVVFVSSGGQVGRPALACCMWQVHGWPACRLADRPRCAEEPWKCATVG
jgi:hypothetical protein